MFGGGVTNEHNPYCILPMFVVYCTSRYININISMHLNVLCRYIIICSK